MRVLKLSRKHTIMQNIKSAALFLLALGFITLQSCKEQAASGNATTGSTPSGKIVYIDIDTLLEKYDLYQESKAILEEESRKAEQSIAGKLETFQKRAVDFQQRVYQTQQRAAELAPVQLQALEKKFAAEQQKLQNEESELVARRDNMARELEGRLIDLQANLKSKIDEHLEKISVERAYDLVLIKGSTGAVLYGNKALDITLQTIKELNELHKASGEKPEEIAKEVASDTTAAE